LLCGTGVTSQSLEFYYSIAVPTTQLFLAYTALALMFFPPLAARKDFLTLLKDNWWKYLILGVIDVEANFLIVLAYKYTSLTSIQLLDSMTIVFVLILSFVFLRVRYLIVHLMGVAMCLIGIISLVLADLTTEREYSTGEGSN
jgi:solute carrier family 35 protein F1/2